MEADLGLAIQPRESQIFIPSWNKHPQLNRMKKQLRRRLSSQLVDFPINTIGLLLGGLPVGTDAFHARTMRAKVASLLAEIPSLAIVDHGFMFKTILRASHLQKLRFFLQGSSPFIPEVTAQVARFDLAIHLALEKYHDWP
eukprot:2384317-Rhodomonas_salina.1